MFVGGLDRVAVLCSGMITEGLVSVLIHGGHRAAFCDIGLVWGVLCAAGGRGLALSDGSARRSSWWGQLFSLQPPF